MNSVTKSKSLLILSILFLLVTSCMKKGREFTIIRKYTNEKIADVINNRIELKNHEFNVFRIISFIDEILKSKFNKLEVKEAVLTQSYNLIKNEILRRNRSFLILSLVLFTCSVRFFFLSKKLKVNLFKVKKLNQNLNDSIIKIKSTNLDLENKNEKIQNLLGLNERTLFSKVLKISMYNDIVSKIGNDLSKLIESEEVIKPINLFYIEKTLKTMINEDDIWNDFQVQFEKTRPNFFKKLKQISPELSINDLKHCSYIISKLRTKDVANLVNVSPRSVETVRYRIKKKLNLDKNSSLFNFLQSLS